MDTNRFKNITAEQNILGSILVDNNSIIEIADMITPTDFSETRHMIIYSNMLELYKQNKPIDITTIYNKQGKQATEIGGLTYLSELSDSGIPKHIKEHAKIIKEKSKMRSLNLMVEKALKGIKDGKSNSQDIISWLQNQSMAINESVKSNTVTDNVLMEKTLNIIQTNYENGGGILGFETGINTLDRAINGLQKKKLYVIAGRPGMAKSAFALNLAQKLSEKHKIMYYSLEMAEEELGIRRLAMRAFVDSGKIERGSMSDEEWTKIMSTSAAISKGQCITDCTPGVHLDTIRAQCKRMQLQGGIEGLVIDYLGLMSVKNMGDSLREQLGNICVNLKNIAKDFDMPVILLAQLSRAPEGRTDHRPMLSDLKETGGIEENADVVMLLYRDEYYNKETEEKNIIEVNIAKQRGGRTGTIKLSWLPQFQKVGDLDYIHEGDYNPEVFKG